MVKIGFMASHGGSGMEAVLQAIQNGLNAKPVVLIYNNTNAVAAEVAKNYNLLSCHLSSSTHQDNRQLDQAICSTLKRFNIDLLMLSGYMKHIGPLTLSEFEGKILNIHPALLPKYGGKGMYGDYVHKAVLENGETQSGASVHIVTAEYDQGPVLINKKVSLESHETVESLRNKIKKLEGGLYVETLEKIISGEIHLSGLTA